jgi:hypothetical protein
MPLADSQLCLEHFLLTLLIYLFEVLEFELRAFTLSHSAIPFCTGFF